MSQQPSEPTTVLEAFRRTAASSPDRPLMIYFDGVLTAADVDRASDAFAVALADNGFGAGVAAARITTREAA